LELFLLPCPPSRTTAVYFPL